MIDSQETWADVVTYDPARLEYFVVSDSTLFWSHKNRSGLLQSWRSSVRFSVQGGATAAQFVDLLAGRSDESVLVLLIWNLNDLVSTKGNVWRRSPNFPLSFKLVLVKRRKNSRSFAARWLLSAASRRCGTSIGPGMVIYPLWGA